MTVNQAMQWYEHQKRYDTEARIASEAVLGRELHVFVTAMEVTARSLDLARESGPEADIALKRKIGLATNAFNLLWSAWDAALAGRYSAAANHWRSIDETCDLLRAIELEPAFADRMGGNKAYVRSARRIIRDGMARNIGGGREWLQSRQSTAKILQPFSHVSVEATGMALGLAEHEGRKVGVLRPGGVPARKSLKLHASCLASDAVRLALAVTSSLTEVTTVQTVYEEEVPNLVSWANTTLAEELASEPRGPSSETEVIILLASTDEPPAAPAEQVGIS